MQSMRMLPIVVTVIMTIQAGPTAQSSKGTSAQVNELLAVDNTWGKYFTSCDLDGMLGLITDDFTIIQLGGTIWSKSQYMDMVKRCSMQVGERLGVARAEILGDTAVIVGTFKYQMKDQKEPLYHIYHRTYVKRDGRWRLLVDSHVPSKTEPIIASPIVSRK